MSLRQNGLMLIVATALLGIAAQWAGIPALTRLWALPLALLLLGLAYERWVCTRAALHLNIHSPEPWHLAQAAEVRWQLRHSLPRTLSVMLAPHLPVGLDAATAVRTVRVPGADGAMLDLPAVSRRLGEIRWPAQPARLAGPLGLAWWSLKLAAQGHSRVVPAMLSLKESAVGAALAGSRISKAMGPGSQVEQLRDYRPGDPLRVIDWRATARRRQMVSRDFAEDQHLDVTVALDVGRSSRIQCGDLDRLGRSHRPGGVRRSAARRRAANARSQRRDAGAGAPLRHPVPEYRFQRHACGLAGAAARAPAQPGGADDRH
jgi:uncharacterized protein (DUF58 family)